MNFFFFFFHLAGLLSIHDRPLFFLFLLLLLLSSLLLFLLFFTRRPPVINRNLFFFPLFFWSLSSHRTPPTSQPCGSPCVKIRDERIPSSRFLLLFYCVCVCACVCSPNRSQTVDPIRSVLRRADVIQVVRDEIVCSFYFLSEMNSCLELVSRLISKPV